MAIEQLVPDVAPTPEQIREAAIRELEWAIVMLRCGDAHEAANKAQSSLAWIHELG